MSARPLAVPPRNASRRPSSSSSAGGTPASAAAIWGALGIVYVVWGSTYLAIRVMVETVPPLLGAGVRFAFAGLVVLAVLAARRGRAGARLTGREWAAAALVGTLLAAGGNGLVTVAERDVPSALAALVIASVPLWVVVLRAVARERVGWRTLAGVLAGFGGIALLLAPGERPDGATTAGLVLLVIAAASWATGSYASGRLPLPRDPFVSTGAQMLCGGVVMIAAGLLAGEAGDVRPERFSTESVLAFAYLVVFGSFVAFTAYVWLLQHTPVSRVATYAYVNPVVAVILGWLILDETISATTLLAAAVIVASVAAIVRSERPDPQPSSARSLRSAR